VSRVYLATPERTDQDAFLTAVRKSHKLHGRFVAPPDDPATFREYMARLGRPSYAGHLIKLRSNGDLVGVVNVNEIVRGCFQSAYLGYYGFAGYTGRGLMTEGLRLAVQHAFTDLRLHRLEANIQPDNRASIRLVERLGFELEGRSRRYLKICGRWRDHERYAILAEDWRRLRAGKHGASVEAMR